MHRSVLRVSFWSFIGIILCFVLFGMLLSRKIQKQAPVTRLPGYIPAARVA